MNNQPFIIRVILRFFWFVISAAANSLRIFLRIRLGERVLSFGTVILSYTWVCYFLTKKYAFCFSKECDDESYGIITFFEGSETFEWEVDLTKGVFSVFFYIFSFIAQLLSKIWNTFLQAIYVIIGGSSERPEFSEPVYWCSIVIFGFRNYSPYQYLS